MANCPPPQQQHHAPFLLPGADFDRPDYSSRHVPFPVWVIGATAAVVALVLGLIFGWRLHTQQRRRREVVQAVELAAIG